MRFRFDEDIIETMLPVSLLFATGWAITLLVVRLRHREPGDSYRCVTCGYDLTSLTSNACPECGEDLTAIGVHPPGKPKRGVMVHVAFSYLLLIGNVTSIAWHWVFDESRVIRGYTSIDLHIHHGETELVVHLEANGSELVYPLFREKPPPVQWISLGLGKPLSPLKLYAFDPESFDPLPGRETDWGVTTAVADRPLSRAGLNQWANAVVGQDHPLSDAVADDILAAARWLARLKAIQPECCDTRDYWPADLGIDRIAYSGAFESDYFESLFQKPWFAAWLVVPVGFLAWGAATVWARRRWRGKNRVTWPPDSAVRVNMSASDATSVSE